MKKVLALILAISILLALAACGSKGETDTEPSSTESQTTTESESSSDGTGKKYDGITLTMSFPIFQSEDTDIGFWTEKFAQFEEETGCKVEPYVIDMNNITTIYKTLYMAGELPDVVYTCWGSVVDMINMDMLLDFNELLTQEEIDDLIYAEQCTYKGKMYQVAYLGGSSPRCLMLNMDILNAAGVEEIPNTWDELIEAGKKVKEYDSSIYPYLTCLSGAHAGINNYYEYVAQAGGSYCTEDMTNYAFTSQPCLDAITFFRDMIFEHEILSKDAIDMTEENVEALFTEGKVAMINSYSGWNYNDCDFNLKIRTDMSKEEGGPTGCFNVFDCYSISASSEHPDAALDLVRFLFRDDVYQDFCDTLFDSQPVLYSQGEFETDPLLAEDALAHPERFSGPAPLPGIGSVFTEIGNGMQLVAMGELTPEEFCTQLQEFGENALLGE